MSQLCENAISQLVRYHMTLNEGPGALKQQRRLRILVISRRFSSALRSYEHLNLEVELDDDDKGPGNAERFTGIVCALLKLAFGNQRAERKTVDIEVIIDTFDYIFNPNHTQQLSRLLLAVRGTEIPVRLNVVCWDMDNIPIDIMWMAADVLGRSLVEVSGYVDYVPILQKLPTTLAKVEIELNETKTSIPMSSIVQIPSETISLTGNLGSLVGDGCYKINPTLKLLTFELSTEDLMENWNFADEFKVLRTIGSQLEVSISAGDSDAERNLIHDFGLNTQQSLMAQLEQRLSRFRQIADIADECGVTLRSLRLQKHHSSNGLDREIKAFYDEQNGYTCDWDGGMLSAHFKTKYRHVEFDITDVFR